MLLTLCPPFFLITCLTSKALKKISQGEGAGRVTWPFCFNSPVHSTPPLPCFPPPLFSSSSPFFLLLRPFFLPLSPPFFFSYRALKIFFTHSSKNFDAFDIFPIKKIHTCIKVIAFPQIWFYFILLYLFIFFISRQNSIWWRGKRQMKAKRKIFSKKI